MQHKLIAMDSIQKSFIEMIGIGAGERNENVIIILQEIIRDFKTKKSIRTVTANF